MINAQIRGLPPGNPPDYFDAANPHTFVHVTIAEASIELGVPCPASVPYTASSAPDAFEMVQPLRLGFGDQPPGPAGGKRAHITIDVVGSNGLTASAFKDVTLGDPP